LSSCCLQLIVSRVWFMDQPMKMNLANPQSHFSLPSSSFNQVQLLPMKVQLGLQRQIWIVSALCCEIKNAYLFAKERYLKGSPFPWYNLSLVSFGSKMLHLLVLTVCHLVSAQQDVLHLEKAVAEMIRTNCNHIICKDMVKARTQLSWACFPLALSQRPNIFHGAFLCRLHDWGALGWCFTDSL